MTDEAFYRRTAPDVLVPTPATVGPWDRALQHGGPPAAMLCDALDRAFPRADARVAHFSMDFLGPVPLEPMTIVTEVARAGKKVELLVATASIAGRAVLRATAWRIATEAGRNPEAGMDEPSPPLPPPRETPLFAGVPRFGYGESLEWRFVEGGFTELGPATVWSRLRVAIVGGEPVSAVSRALAMVDSANGISLELDVRTFVAVPVNLTVSLTRAPEGEWVGMSARTVLAGDGVGTTRARLFDARGRVGEAMQTLFVAPRRG